MINFLKPTKVKIILTLLFFLAFSLIPAIPCRIGGTDGSPFKSNIEIAQEHLLKGHWTICQSPASLSFFGGAGSFTDYFGIVSGGILFALLYSLIVSYILSCACIHFLYSERFIGINFVSKVILLVIFVMTISAFFIFSAKYIKNYINPMPYRGVKDCGIPEIVPGYLHGSKINSNEDVKTIMENWLKNMYYKGDAPEIQKVFKEGNSYFIETSMPQKNGKYYQIQNGQLFKINCYNPWQ